MPQLWYTSDEVADFHPIVEDALTNALINCGYNLIAEVVHHPSIPNSTIIPDFGIRLRGSQRFIFICEVKRTERDVDSQRYQNQTRTYVTDFGQHWENGYHKYFCITNVERLILLADRQGPLTTCVLKNNPKQHTKFNPIGHDASQSAVDLLTTFQTILPLIFNRTIPDWDNNWEPIISNFHTNFVALKNSLNYPDQLAKELSLYELFRLLAYAYLKDFYTQMRSPNAAHFHNYPGRNLSLEQYRNSLSTNYDRIIQLDFRQVFSNHPNQGQRIFPDNLSARNVEYFKNLIQCFSQYSYNAVVDNSSPSYVFNLLTSRIYEREELHRKGKVMSDAEIANLLATLCIDNDTATILDPGSGDGSLLDAGYDQLYLQSLNRNNPKTHNQILTQVAGIEIDPFLSQLSAFRLLSKSLNQINNVSEANVTVGDIFDEPRPREYDAVLMNPPFLRNDDPLAPISVATKNKMVAAIQAQQIQCFVTDARQPNLYFYFVNYAWHYLRDGGKMGVIIMAKFLNNKDGEYLKNFILDKVEAIISYPRKYFQEFVVTTVIVILKNGHNSDNISFLRISDESYLLNADSVKSIIALNRDETTPSYRQRMVARNAIDPASNWRQYLLDPKCETLLALNLFSGIENYFDNITRGSSETNGGSKIIYPDYEEATTQYHATAAGAARVRIDLPMSLNQYVSYGIQNNFDRRHYVLNVEDLLLDKSFHFPARADANSANGLPANLQDDVELDQFYTACSQVLTIAKWRRIINNARKSTIIPKILIPRADRTKHVVYYNPNNHEVTLSTNFFYCNGIKNINADLDDEQQYKFMTAYLLSCYGQIQFELNANNQEGLRKLEGFHIARFKVPDLRMLSADEINSVVVEFDALNALNAEVNGTEGLNTPRRSLDVSISKLIFDRDPLGFNNRDEMTDYFELFLADLVEDRRL